MISVHGLIRGHDLELGANADTGGQTKYVVDLARTLGEESSVSHVDLITRWIDDDHYSDDYWREIEPLSDHARIVRIPCGPDEYVAKELLWDHLDSFADNLAQWLHQQPRMPDLLHSHYADAGYVAVKLSNLLGIPQVHTAHSLGRDKRKRLLASGLTRDEIEARYNMSRRIDAEEDVLANADLVITSTHNEIEEQYGLYNYYTPAHMTVIAPGTDLERFHPPGEDVAIPFAEEVNRFLKNTEKPLILALSRPDERKNLPILVEAFGESKALQKEANLLIITGNRDDIRDLEVGAQTVLTDILILLDAYDLYGRVALPKAHRQDEVPRIYRLVAAGHGVFVNPALTEPFGLTLLEAAASGVPIVATENGGPVDIIANCQCGLLVNPLDKAAITRALLQLLRDSKAWQRASRNGITGVRRHYSWQAHTQKYLQAVAHLVKRKASQHREIPAANSLRYRNHAIFTDLDQNLIGDPVALREFVELIRANRKHVSFGIVTGRRIDAALATMRQHNVPRPDILISSLGTRINYGPQLTEDHEWIQHIDHDWSLGKIRQVLADVPGLALQPRMEQSSFKLSFYYDAAAAPPVDDIMALLHKREVNANVILAFGQFLDVFPARAGKGQSLRYVAQRLDIPLEQILVAGGSGADEDMMRGNTLGLVVANRHHEELSQLEETDRIYFAKRPYAGGILDAIEHYDYLAFTRRST